MLPSKIDQPFILVPVSRVGLSARLNQLNGSRPASRPATPSAYVTSSLNPTRNLPVSLTDIRLKIAQEDLEKFDSLPISLNLKDFEATFNDLSQSVLSFKEEEIAPHVERLIDILAQISLELDILKQHQALGLEINTLESENAQLNVESKHILQELILCRQQLKKLPRLPAKGQTKTTSEVSIQELLNYAMKLAKFSKAPPTVNSQMIHPNNYVWPAEDALRRGTLAIASLKPDELIKAEIGDILEEQPGKEDVKMEDVEMKDVKPGQPQEKQVGQPRKVHVESNGQSNGAATLDLDLFDPDDDDSDDE